MKFFTRLEADTLERLYPQREEWWTFLYLLTDEIQERCGEEAAEGLRLLWKWKYRPYSNTDPPNDQFSCWWFVVLTHGPIKFLSEYGDQYQNYLPRPFMSTSLHCFICDTITDALEKYLVAYTSLTDDVREDLLLNYTPKEPRL